jgi:flagellar basal-body rod protein FlgC
MGLFNIFDIAGSGLSAQSLRLNATASNIANAESAASSTGQTYRARQPVFSTVLNHALGDGSSAGVKVLGVVESPAPLRTQYAPDHPLADKSGFIHLPNVNVVEEMANMISASRTYQSNLEIMNTSKTLMMRTLTLGQ